MSHPVVLELPERLYKYFQQIATTNEGTVEATLLDALEVLSGVSTEDIDSQLARLEDFSDAQLWSIVAQRLTAKENERLDYLMENNKLGKLSDTEQVELETLVAKINRQMLLRSDALLRLKQRGYDADNYFYSNHG